MRTRKLLAMILAVAVASPAIAALWIDAKPGVDFRQYRTFAWREGTPARRMEVQSHIESVVGRELVAKGLVQGAGEEVDLHVSTHVLVDKHTLQDLSNPEYWEFWAGVRSVDAYDLRAGTLVIDLVDARTGERVWRGVSNSHVSGPVDRNLKKTDKLIRKMLKRFPPR